MRRFLSDTTGGLCYKLDLGQIASCVIRNGAFWQAVGTCYIPAQYDSPDPLTLRMTSLP